MAELAKKLKRLTFTAELERGRKAVIEDVPCSSSGRDEWRRASPCHIKVGLTSLSLQEEKRVQQKEMGEQDQYERNKDQVSPEG